MRTIENNINVQAFSDWLGVNSKEYLNDPTCFIHPHQIGEVRALFDRLTMLTRKDRKLVMQWGLYVQDIVVVQLIIWGTLRLQNEKEDLNILGHEIENKLRVLLFTPYISELQGKKQDHIVNQRVTLIN